ncbi:hypothetical protein BP5796_01015 [Coleophoma crateriformis]|uniref:GRF-type domain-containing protein n=1 Tax=Coleophoma crateriformis TaxID=565419 RepID=A0A3D8T9J8_9HELO|nr:hypothetical protein BP5796_01015 [Coleophoma crateriformis]
MPSTPQNDTPRKHPYTPTTNRKGLFSDGVWHCDCDPRLPASYFIVKKTGPNRGRGFYTCQEPKGTGCGFFLWEESATPREMRTVLENSRSEPESAMEPAPPPPAKRQKRVLDSQSTASTDSDNDDEFGDFPLSPADVQEVIAVAERNSAYPETPRKPARTDYMATPSTKRKRDEAKTLLTPVTSHGGDSFMTPSTSRLKGILWDRNEQSGASSSTAMLTPANGGDGRSEDARGEGYELTEEAMDILRNEAISNQSSSALRQLLNKFALRASGVARGREITRVALKTKDAKIAELQQRISTLESEREMDKAVIRRLRGDIRSYGTTT